MTTIASGPKTPENSGYTRNVTDIDFWNGRAYIADEQYPYIKVVNATTFEEEREIRIYENGGWSGAHGLAIDPATGNMFIANYSEDLVTVYDQDGNRLYTFGSRGSGDGQFQSPRDVAIINDVVYVSDAAQSRIQAFTMEGDFLGKWGGYGSGPYEFRNPMGLDALDGKLYVSDVENGRISVFDTAEANPAFQWDRPSLSQPRPVPAPCRRRWFRSPGPRPAAKRSGTSR